MLPKPLLLLFICLPFFVQGQNVINIDFLENSLRIAEKIEVLDDPEEKYHFTDLKNLEFYSFSKGSEHVYPEVQWVKIRLQKPYGGKKKIKISIAFADSLELFFPDLYGNYARKTSGDTYPLSERDVKLGQVILFDVPLYTELQTIYVRITSRGNLSYEARKHTLNSFTLITEEGYQERFETPRYYQSLFYGALIIMLFYNLFLVFTVKSRSYLYYTLYLSITILFFAANNGYLLEFFIPEYPKADIFIRFLLAPLLLTLFVLFSLGFLNTHKYAPKWEKGFYVLIGILSVSVLIMISGYWMLGRNINILLAVVIFLMVLFLAVIVYRRGFKPARYFLIANFLVLLGGIIFALEKLSLVVHNPLTQYSVQISIVFEMALFSLGLADRINLIRKQLADEKLEKELMEKEQLNERKRLIEQKNQELEVKVKERTAEVVAQKEEIEEQNTKIRDSIQYASRIQRAVLGPTDKIIESFSKVPENDAFVFFQPKDIVSGDFYWYAEVGNVFDQQENGHVESLPEFRIAIAADCTGHGVPGAFMTMLGSSLLEEIIIDHGIIDPSEILLELDKKVTQTMTRNENYSTSDGMDMTVLVFKTQTNEVFFAGAKNPLFTVIDGEVEKTKGSFFPIGSLQYGKKKQFKTHVFQASKGQPFYIFSDGFQDQFGGPDDQKYMVGRFRKLVAEMSHLPMKRQKDIIEEEFLSWKGDTFQTDDVLVMGFRV